MYKTQINKISKIEVLCGVPEGAQSRNVKNFTQIEVLTQFVWISQIFVVCLPSKLQNMRVKLQSVTPQAEENIVEIARVSSSRVNKREDYDKLINYLIKNNHWSPFEHGFMTVEIETSKAIGIQLIRHRSFTFQEFSQRYQDVSKLGDMFEPIEVREQASDNRQSSTEVFNPQGIYIPHQGGQEVSASEAIELALYDMQELYKQLLDAGVAREVARMVLPMATKTRIYMTGSVRSWIHFLDIRDDSHAQKEIQEIAKAIKQIFKEEFPVISKALNY